MNEKMRVAPGAQSPRILQWPHAPDAWKADAITQTLSILEAHGIKSGLLFYWVSIGSLQS